MTAGAQDIDPAQAVTDLGTQVNLLWVVIGAVLVIFMQAGFALVETGFCRAKHAAHVVSTNFAIFGLGFVGFFLIGYGADVRWLLRAAHRLRHARRRAASSARGDWVFLWKGGFALTDMVGPGGAGAAALGFFLYMVAFMDTVATIPTGAMAERWKWNSFVGWGLFCGAIYYPLFGAWTWGGGWLAKLGNSMDLGYGYVDFAGSGVVHAVGGVAAPGRGDRARAPHRQVQQGRLAQHDPRPPHPDGHARLLHPAVRLVRLQRRLHLRGDRRPVRHRGARTPPSPPPSAPWSRCSGCMMRTGKPDPGMMVNGMLAGLVAITAPCAFVDPWAAAVIGILAAILVIEAVGFIERRGIDDPVGAIAVHGVGGSFGVLAVGIFANGTYGAGWNVTTDGDGRVRQGRDRHPRRRLRPWPRPARRAGASVRSCIWTVIFGIAFAFFKIQNTLMKGGIRSDGGDEIAGLDLPEMGVLAYPEFEFAIEALDPRSASAAPSSAGTSERQPSSLETVHHRLVDRAGTARPCPPASRVCRARQTSPPHGHRRDPPRHPRSSSSPPRLAAEVSERIGIPAVVGEIVAGIIVGPSVLGLVGQGDEVLRTLGEIGVILLLLEVGMEMDLRELGKVGRGVPAGRHGRGDRADGPRPRRHGAGRPTTSTPRSSSAPRSPPRAWASPPGSSATSGRWPPPRPGWCSARPWPTT